MSNDNHVSHSIVSVQQRAHKKEIWVLTFTVETAHQWIACVIEGGLLHFASSLENNLRVQQWLLKDGKGTCASKLDKSVADWLR